MKALIDADILRYEIGFGAETGIRDFVENGKELDVKPSMTYIEHLLTERVYSILGKVEADDFCLYLTEGENMRDKIATIKPYKGQRKEDKPYQFDNMTQFIKDSLPHKISKYGLEADDMMAMDQISSLRRSAENGREGHKGDSTVICSRDKDLMQVPGWHYSWGCGKQKEAGLFYSSPSTVGDIQLEGTKLTGHGLMFFYAQLLMGDSTDNIAGVPKVGPKKAYALLTSVPTEGMLNAIAGEYGRVYGDGWKDAMTENGQLLWMVRRLSSDCTPEMYYPGTMREESYHGQSL